MIGFGLFLSIGRCLLFEFFAGCLNSFICVLTKFLVI